MNRLQGFTLIEFLIYCTLTVSTVLLINVLLCRCIRTTAFCSAKNTAFMQLQAAASLLVRDLTCFATDEAVVYEHNNRCCIWGTPKGDIGWIHTQQSLFRKTGTYNQKTGRWDRSVSSLIANQVDECKITMNFQSGTNCCISLYLAHKATGTMVTREVVPDVVIAGQ